MADPCLRRYVCWEVVSRNSPSRHADTPMNPLVLARPLRVEHMWRSVMVFLPAFASVSHG